MTLLISEATARTRSPGALVTRLRDRMAAHLAGLYQTTPDRVEFRVGMVAVGPESLTWDGAAERPALRELGTYARRHKPEGITRVSTAGRDFSLIVFDTSGYAAAD